MDGEWPPGFRSESLARDAAGAMKLLIVDDHANTRLVIRELANGLASGVRECPSIGQALESCVHFEPDFITLNMALPGTSAVDAIRRLRALHPDACLIVLTQAEHPALENRVRRAGADHFIPAHRLVALREYFADSAGRADRCPDS